MPPAVAAVAGGQNEAMGRAILATADTFAGADEMRRRTERTGARVEVLEGLCHWWMLEDPARAALALTRFWGSLPHSLPS